MNKEKLKKLLLSEKHKRTILDFIFSMSGIVFLIVVAELVLLFLVYRNFLNYIAAIYGIVVVIDVIVLLYMLNREKVNFEIKTTWAIIILLLPLLGSFMYFYITFDIFNRSYKKRFFNIEKESLNYLKQDEKTLKKIENDPKIMQLHNYLIDTGNPIIYDHCQVNYFESGEKAFSIMLEELKKAEKFIFLEYFIISQGKMWDAILEILLQKVQQNVDVRVIYDGTCDFAKLPSNYPRGLRLLGIKCYKFAPLLPIISPYYNFRDHRKLMIIDGKVAFTGGINLADEYMNQLDLYGYWKDTVVMLKGKAVQSYTLMFLQMHSLVANTDDFSLINDDQNIYDEDGLVIPYGDVPFDKYVTGKNVYLFLLNSAVDYVYIMTPYFIVDSELLNGIYNAALRGVDVRLILPGNADKVTVNEIAKSKYKDLLSNKVKIYELKDSFIHAKQVICDDDKAVVGTINFDYRSLYHHFEDGLFLYKNSAIKDIKEDFMKTFEKSNQIKEYEPKKFKQIIAKIAKPFEPLL